MGCYLAMIKKRSILRAIARHRRSQRNLASNRLTEVAYSRSVIAKEESSMWSGEGHLQHLGLNMEQSVKKGVPIPNITEDLACWHSVLGRRVVNEDRVSVNKLTDNCLYFAVFDGHGSSDAADFMMKIIPPHLESWLKYSHNIQVGLKQTFVDVNNLYSRSMWSSLISTRSDVQAQENRLKSGTTAVVAVLRNSQELVVASVGDSSAILCRAGVAHPLNTLHVPSDQAEQDRIETRGGFIASNSIGQLLVNARLSMTRSLGDLQLHSNGVIPNPSTKSIEIKHHKDQFLLLVTDGISQVLPEQEMANIVTSCSHPQDACRLLTDVALQYGSDDNSTALVVPLGAWGKNTSSLKSSSSKLVKSPWVNAGGFLNRRD